MRIVVILSLLFGLHSCAQQPTCPRKPHLVYHEKGDVTVAALLDLTQGLQCNQSNPASRQSMNGMLQTFQTLNSIQYLNGAKLGIRVYDTCGQESMAMQAVMETVLDSSLTYSHECRDGAHLGFLFPLHSYPSVEQLMGVFNLPVTDISYWQATSPLDAVMELLTRLKWTSVAVVSQSKQTLLSFSKAASQRSVCIVAQSVLSPIYRTKDMTVRVVRRTKRSGSKVYVLIGSSEFLLSVLPYFQSNSTSALKYVLVAADNWSANFSYEVSQNVHEALLVQPQRVMTDDNVSARVLYTLVKQFKNHMTSTCNGRINPCDFEPRHLKKITLADDDMQILKLSKDISIYNELFPVTLLLKNNIIDLGNIHEDKFIANENVSITIETAECFDCLCTNVDVSADLELILRTELYIILIGAVSVLGIIIILMAYLLLAHIRCSGLDDRSGNFLFMLMLPMLLMLLVSFLYVLEPSSTVCLSRVISLSGSYTCFLGAILSIMATSLVAHPAAKTGRFILQALLFCFIVSVQIPVLTYETFFRDETLLTNKMLTDYGPKIECTLDELLCLKLFIYPIVLLVLVCIGGLTIILHHWLVPAIKVRLGVAGLLCSIVNVGWGLCYFVLDKDWRDVDILFGIQGNVYVMLMVVVLPKIVTGFVALRQTIPMKDFGLTAEEMARATGGGRSPRSGRTPIYAIPHEYDRRSEEISLHDQTTAM